MATIMPPTSLRLLTHVMVPLSATAALTSSTCANKEALGKAATTLSKALMVSTLSSVVAVADPTHIAARRVRSGSATMVPPEILRSHM